ANLPQDAWLNGITS
ncbi:unnamed protein product, partial [Diplocarpon coronariae]